MRFELRQALIQYQDDHTLCFSKCCCSLSQVSALLTVPSDSVGWFTAEPGNGARIERQASALARDSSRTTFLFMAGPLNAFSFSAC